MDPQELEQLAQAVAEILVEDGLSNDKDPIGYMKKSLDASDFEVFSQLLIVKCQRILEQQLRQLISRP